MRHQSPHAHSITVITHSSLQQPGFVGRPWRIARVTRFGQKSVPGWHPSGKLVPYERETLALRDHRERRICDWCLAPTEEVFPAKPMRQAGKPLGLIEFHNRSHGSAIPGRVEISRLVAPDNLFRFSEMWDAAVFAQLASKKCNNLMVLHIA